MISRTEVTFYFLCVVVILALAENVYGRVVKEHPLSDNVYRHGAQIYPGRCEIAYTRYTLPERCDTYMECNDGMPTRKTCRYGQYFYNITDVGKYPCEYLDREYCGNRHYYQQYVYDDSLCGEQFSQPQFRVGNATTCNEYVECSQGELFNKKCDSDTAFHPIEHICVWPGDSPDCDAPSFCAHIGKGYNDETKMCTSYYYK